MDMKKDGRGRPTKPIPERRQCQICNKLLQINMFYRSKGHSGGYNYICKDCNKDIVLLKGFQKLIKIDLVRAKEILDRDTFILELKSCAYQNRMNDNRCIKDIVDEARRNLVMT